MPIYRRVLRYYRPFVGPTVAGLVLALAGIAFNLLKPWPLKIIVDDLIPLATGAAGTGAAWQSQLARHPYALPILCGAVVLIQLLWGLMNRMSNLLFVRVGLQALMKLRTELYAYLQGLSLKYHDAQRSSDSSFRVAYDSQSIQTMYNQGFTNIFASVVTLLGTFAVMVGIDWQLTLLSLGVVPLIAGAIYYFAQRIRAQSVLIQERDSALLAHAQEGLSSVRMVHAFGREDWEVSQFKGQAHQSLRANLELTLTNVNSALVISTLMALGTAAMYYIGTRHVINGTLTLGSLLVFSAYLVMLYQPLESLTYTAWAMEGATAGAQRCFEVLDRADDVKDSPHATTLPKTSGALNFEKVDFGYTADQPILRGIDLHIAPNQIVGIVGGTGAGKSTLLSLVPRFYDPTDGRVKIDGYDLRDFTKKSLRSHIGIVLQDTLLFSTTIRENIAYGRPGATEEQIRSAARRAQADEFISRLPQGYDSPVGERGGHLSVGQRQRIGIARAFLKDAPILLLDEPTSALDPTTEAAIMDTVKELMRNRTTLIVTHRLATIHGVDKIVVLERGSVVEQGTGAELLARGGAYASLYASGNYPRPAAISP
jgi:ATP-binding cassette subfamily B protein/subfamily B ATP-binding cassette protein MsbA